MIYDAMQKTQDMDEHIWMEHQLWVAMQIERFPPERILAAVAAAHTVTVPDMLTQTRISMMAYARHHAVWELRRRRLDLSFPKIARVIGRKDHTTAVHSYYTFNAAVHKGYYKPHLEAVAKALGDEA
jgi:chromosomal replication initiation ATPase DnaA